MNAAIAALAIAGAGALSFSPSIAGALTPLAYEQTQVDMSSRDSLTSRDTARNNDSTPSVALISDFNDSPLLIWTLVGVGAFAGGAVSVAVARRRARTELASA